MGGKRRRGEKSGGRGTVKGDREEDGGGKEKEGREVGN